MYIWHYIDSEKEKKGRKKKKKGEREREKVVDCLHHQSISFAHSWHYIKVKLKAALEGSCMW